MSVRWSADVRWLAAMVALALVLGGCGDGGMDEATPEPTPEPLFDAAELEAATPTAAPQTDLRFVDGAERVGIDFTHVPSRTDERHMPEIIGAGVGVADFNRDGAPEVVLVNSGRLGAETRPPDAANRFYLNDGSGRLVDASAEWGFPAGDGYGMGLAVGDYDNDGWNDLFLTTFGDGETLLRNTGQGFVDVTDEAGIAPDGRWSTSAGFFDLEGDGDLDLYIAKYVRFDPETAVKCYSNEVHVYCTPVLYDAEPDRLLRNNGDGTFEDISREAGLLDIPPTNGLALTIGDIDIDGDMDVYVANDITPNRLLVNDGQGRLEDRGQISGVAYSEAGVEEAGMGADFSDFDGDGLLDIVTSNFQGETSSVYRQDDGLFFREVSDAVGVGRTARARLSFGVDFFDADNDGDEDLLSANGHLYDNVRRFSDSVTFEQRNSLFENLGTGDFRDVTAAAGSALEDKQVSRGLATGDLDSDGDLDFVFANNGGQAQVGLNETADPGHFVNLWLEGRTANRTAIGARVRATVGSRVIERQVHGASSFLSFSDPRVHLGLGDAEQIDELTVFWPGGDSQTIRSLEAGRFYHLVEGEAPTPYEPGETTIEP